MKKIKTVQNPNAVYVAGRDAIISEVIDPVTMKSLGPMELMAGTVIGFDPEFVDTKEKDHE